MQPIRRSQFHSHSNVWIKLQISVKFVSDVPINNIPALVQVMAWHRPGDKPFSEPVMVSLPTPICVTRLQWVKNTGLSWVIQNDVYIYASVDNTYISCDWYLNFLNGSGTSKWWNNVKKKQICMYISSNQSQQIISFLKNQCFNGRITNANLVRHVWSKSMPHCGPEFKF